MLRETLDPDVAFEPVAIGGDDPRAGRRAPALGLCRPIAGVADAREFGNFEDRGRF
jgi:hypothetical protein